MVLTSTHNLCFKQIYEKYHSFLPENFQVLEVKLSIYLNRSVFVMCGKNILIYTGTITDSTVWCQLYLSVENENLYHPF